METRLKTETHKNQLKNIELIQAIGFQNVLKTSQCYRLKYLRICTKPIVHPPLKSNHPIKLIVHETGLPKSDIHR